VLVLLFLSASTKKFKFSDKDTDTFSNEFLEEYDNNEDQDEYGSTHHPSLGKYMHDYS